MQVGLGLASWRKRGVAPLTAPFQQMGRKGQFSGTDRKGRKQLGPGQLRVAALPSCWPKECVWAGWEVFIPMQPYQPMWAGLHSYAESQRSQWCSRKADRSVSVHLYAEIGFCKVLHGLKLHILDLDVDPNVPNVLGCLYPGFWISPWPRWGHATTFKSGSKFPEVWVYFNQGTVFQVNLIWKFSEELLLLLISLQYGPYIVTFQM